MDVSDSEDAEAEAGDGADGVGRMEELRVEPDERRVERIAG